MILQWQETEREMPSLVAQPQQYDAFAPVDALMIGALPVKRHPDREALAGYLAFGRWTSGDLVLPNGLSPFVAEAIEDDAHPVRLRPRDVELTPRAAPRGRRAVTFHADAPGDTRSPAWNPVLAVIQSMTARGVSSAGTGLAVASNAFVLDHGEAPRIRARLAVAVLFAEDVDADSLHLEGADLPLSEVARLSALLHSVNLGFSADDAGREGNTGSAGR